MLIQNAPCPHTATMQTNKIKISWKSGSQFNSTHLTNRPAKNSKWCIFKQIDHFNSLCKAKITERRRPPTRFQNNNPQYAKKYWVSSSPLKKYCPRSKLRTVTKANQRAHKQPCISKNYRCYFLIQWMLVLYVILATFSMFEQLRSPIIKTALLLRRSNVIIKFLKKNAFKSLYFEHNSISYSLSKV